MFIFNNAFSFLVMATINSYFTKQTSLVTYAQLYKMDKIDGHKFLFAIIVLISYTFFHVKLSVDFRQYESIYY